MYQLRNLVGRSNVSTNPVKNYNSCDDFFKLIVTCYVLAAALKQLNMQSLSDIPTINGVNEPQNLWMHSIEERKGVLQEICEGIVDEFASFQFNKLPTLSQDKVSVVS